MTIEKDAGESVDVDLAVDWRAQDTLTLSIEPVPSVEEAVGKEVSAAYGRRQQTRPAAGADAGQRPRTLSRQT